MRRTRGKNRIIALPEITLTPLIDTALTLLIIFMVTTPMMKDSLKITLPEVSNPGEKVGTQNKLEIFVAKNNNIQINDKNIKNNDLINEIKKYLKQSRDKIIIVNGDKDVPYNSIIKILDQINSIEGEKYVALVAKRAGA